MRLKNYEILFDELISDYKESKKNRYLISIAGCSRAGKTTLAKKLQKDLKGKGISSKIISIDNWLLAIDERQGNETVRQRYRYNKISKDIKKLKNGEKVYTRIYDHKTRKIICNKSKIPYHLKRKEIGIIDGVVTLDIRDLRLIFDYKIYVEIDDEIRKKRVFDFYVNYKNYSLDEAKKIIEPREKEEVKIIKETKKYADFKIIVT